MKLIRSSRDDVSFHECGGAFCGFTIRQLPNKQKYPLPQLLSRFRERVEGVRVHNFSLNLI